MSQAAPARVQRRTISTLVAAQAVGAVGITIGIATASLLALDLSGSERYAGLAQTSQVLGAAVASYLLARLMGARGRRIGLTTGLLTGAAGSVLAVVAGVLESLPVLLVGALLLGSTTAANQGARYAATDLADGAHRGRALSTVVWATTIGAVAGPNLTGVAGWGARRVGLPSLTGPFLLSALALVAAAMIVHLFLRPDPLLVARERGGESLTAPGGTAFGRAWAVMRRQPVLLAAIVGLCLAHAVMVSVMVMTPLHMEHGGASLEVIGVVISIHVLGMFAFSPLVGWASDRWGRGPVLTGGALVLAAALWWAGGSPEGWSPGIAVGLFLLGLGWSMATVAASTLVADHSPLPVRTDVQGLADVVMSLAGALGGAASGVLMEAGGYQGLALASTVLAVGVALAGAAAWRAGRPRHDTPVR